MNAIKLGRNNQLIGINNNLANKLLFGDHKSFWSYYRYKFCRTTSFICKVNDIQDAQLINIEFLNSFKNNVINSINVASKNKFLYLYEKQLLSDGGLMNTYKEFSVEKINDIFVKLKLCKAPGCDGIVNEHVKYPGYMFAIVLHKLFKMCIAHGYVPNDFNTRGWQNFLSLIMPNLAL